MQFFRVGWDDRVLLVPAIKNTSQEIKEIFLFFGPMNPYKDWKTKLDRAHFLKVQLCKIPVCLALAIL